MPTHLVILAGGLGKRFGGNKPFTPFGPRGELLLEFTLFDARRAGIETAVLVIPPGTRDAVDGELAPRVSGLNLRYVEQDRWRPYADVETPNRERPWGTGHAAAIGCLDEADCCVIVNADDWYGPRAITDLLATDLAACDAALVTWPLAATLSDQGGVYRGVCELDGRALRSIVECYDIRASEGVIRGDMRDGSHDAGELAADTPVSLNCWALRRPAIDWLRDQTRALVTAHRDDPRLEAQLPTIMMDGMRDGALRIHALAVGAAWAGVTFKADAEHLRRRLADASAARDYPSPLWSTPSS
jgi:CTP:molybdopterin cytidylyltransferase MocA